MDCGHGFINKYGQAFNRYDLLKKVINDISLLCSAIFSKWRYFDYWACGEITSDDRKWFELAFTRLE